MTIKRFNVKAGLSVGPNTPIDVIDANGNATFGSVTANILTGNINAQTIFQNANFYDTRIELGSASGIVAITTNGNTTQFLPSGQINLGGVSTVAGGTYAGSELELASAQTNLKQLRDGNVTVQVGTGGSATNTWTFANTGNLTLPSNTSAINYANGTSILNGDANFDNLTANTIQLANAITPITADVGQMFWDTTYQTATLGMNNGVQQHVGQTQYMVVKATSAITKGQVVMFTGANGNNVQAAPANTASVGFKPEYIIGIATTNIALNATGYITTTGIVIGLNTNSWTVGDILWVDNSTPGALTNVQPSDPNFQIQMAAVTKASGGDGHIQVRPTTFFDLNRITNVTIDTPLEGQVLVYDSANSVWVNGSAGATENVPYISFTATAGQTVFTSATLAQYPAGTPLSVFRNGVLMTPGEYSISGDTLTASIYVSADDLIEIPSRSVAASSSVGYADTAGVAYSVSGSNVSGAVGTANFANFAGNVTVAAQPNITSVGTLTTLVVSGTANIGNLRVTGNVTGNLLPNANITYDLGSSTQRWKDIWLSNSTIHIGGQTISAGANGVVLSGDTTVPNITADETGIVSITGNMVPTANGQSLGTSQSPWSSAYFDGTITANTFTGNGSQLTGIQSSFANLANYATTANSVAGANVTGTVANATYATTAGIANEVAAANITGTISFATNSTNANIANSATLANFANFAGNVTVAAQPNITSVGSLTALTVDGNIVANGFVSFKGYADTVVVPTSSSTFAPDLSTGTIQRFTANSNFTFNGFTNPVSGQSGMCIITQDATGSRVMTSTMKFAGNAKTLSTAANSVDIIAVFYDGISYYASLTKGYA